MPYQSGQRLPGERASRLGHLEVLESDLVNSFVDDFCDFPNEVNSIRLAGQEHLPHCTDPLNLIFGVDGFVTNHQF